MSLESHSCKEAERIPLKLNRSEEEKSFKSTMSSRFFILYMSIKSDIISYLNEYGISIGRNSKEVKEKLAQIIYEVNNNDVVIFAKKGSLTIQNILFYIIPNSSIIIGCSYCERTKKIIHEKQKDINFTNNIVIGTESNMKTALSVALNLMDVTFPQIIIRK